jgi:hypothetical protein
VARTASEAMSQKKKARPMNKPPDNNKGKSDKPMTRGISKYASARQKESNSNLMARA